MSIVKSAMRSPAPVTLSIDEGVTLTATGAVQIHIPFLVNHMDFFPSSFRLDMDGRVLYIDPVALDESDRADIILLTHAHEDHFSIPDIQKLLKPETILLCPAAVFKKLARTRNSCKLTKIAPSTCLSLGGIDIETVGAYNTKSGLITPHPKSAGNVGYVISRGNTRIFHGGDSDVTPEMLNLTSLTAVLLPIDGGNLTMKTEQAAALTNKLKPKFAIPMHYNLGSKGPETFIKLVDKSISVVVMDGITATAKPV